MKSHGSSSVSQWQKARSLPRGGHALRLRAIALALRGAALGGAGFREKPSEFGLHSGTPLKRVNECLPLLRRGDKVTFVRQGMLRFQASAFQDEVGNTNSPGVRTRPNKFLLTLCRPDVKSPYSHCSVRSPGRHRRAPFFQNSVRTAYASVSRTVNASITLHLKLGLCFTSIDKRSEAST